MNRMRQLLSREKRVPALLLAAGALLLLMALGMPKENEPPGWQQLDSRIVDTHTESDVPSPEENMPVQAVSASAEHVSAGSESEDTNAASALESGEGTMAEPAADEPAEIVVSATPLSSEPDAGGKIDINRASAELLDTLPGIGAAKAHAIIADREQNGFFRSAEDITRVKGIGAKMLEKLKEHIVAVP